MKNYKATTTFRGIIRMDKGETKSLDPESIIVKDLLRAKLIIEAEEKKAAKKTTKKAKAVKAETEEVVEAGEDETKGAE